MNTGGIPYGYVPSQRVPFLRLFGLNTGIDIFAYFGLELGMVFEGTREYMDVLSFYFQ